MIVLAGSTAAADEPAEDAKAAIAERGIVLKAGKRNFFVVVPPSVPEASTPKGLTLYQSRVFYGDAKSLIELPGVANTSPEGEYRGLGQDPRYISVQTLQHKGDRYELSCSTTFGPTEDEQRTVTLVPGDASAVAKAALKDAPRVRLGYVVARQSTTYLYVDRIGESTKDMRFFVGKRGAMKQLPIKDIADDTTALVVVTAKGTLTVTRAKDGTPISATFGTGKKPAAADVLPVVHNRKLIYRELGVYTREKTGQPCDEL